MAGTTSSHRRQRFRVAAEVGLLLLPRPVPPSSWHARRSTPGRRLRGPDRVFVRGPGVARTSRSVIVLPAARVSVRAAVGAGTLGERVLGAVPQTARGRGGSIARRASGPCSRNERGQQPLSFFASA